MQDDAWLEYGPGTLDGRLDQLDALGVDVVRVTIDWRATEPRPGVYDWSRADLLLDGLHARGIAPLVTLYGSPALGERRAAGELGADVDDDASPRSRGTSRSATRTSTCGRSGTSRTSGAGCGRRRRATYVKKLLNPAYAAIHSVSPSSQVAGGVTAPRGSTGGVSPVDWIAGMAAAHARLDAYAHNPYPLRPGETPIERRLRPLRDDHDGDAPAPARATCSARSASTRASG